MKRNYDINAVSEALAIKLGVTDQKSIDAIKQQLTSTYHTGFLDAVNRREK